MKTMAHPDRMPPVSDVTWFSSVDWPGRLCATLFLQGCPWRCAYCHNVDLQPMRARDCAGIQVANLFETLQRRVGLLDGVVLSGGEPLYHEETAQLARAIASYGFDTGLHTGGSNPQRLREMLDEIAWVGFDFKAPFGSYDRVTQVLGSGESAQESLELLHGSSVPFEVRTTVDARILTLHDLDIMERELKAHGVDSWILQTCNTTTGLGAVAPNPESLALIQTYYGLQVGSFARLRQNR